MELETAAGYIIPKSKSLAVRIKGLVDSGYHFF